MTDDLEPDEQTERALVGEWLRIPTERIAGRVHRPCPAAWLESEEGARKLLQLTRILQRDPFTAYPQPRPAPQDEEWPPLI